jgi:hypothetical protein
MVVKYLWFGGVQHDPLLVQFSLATSTATTFLRFVFVGHMNSARRTWPTKARMDVVAILLPVS